jgi:hypothetical protein
VTEAAGLLVEHFIDHDVTLEVEENGERFEVEGILTAYQDCGGGEVYLVLEQRKGGPGDHTESLYAFEFTKKLYAEGVELACNEEVHPDGGFCFLHHG